jgi:H+/Cl- antiporter ClcA
MKEHFEEQRVIFLNILKWVILSVLIGIIVGLLTTLFLRGLDFSILFASNYKYYFVVLTFTLLFCSLLINKLAPQSKGQILSMTVNAAKGISDVEVKINSTDKMWLQKIINYFSSAKIKKNDGK